MPAFVAMITDGAESCKPALKSLPPPKNDLSLLFILVPESGNTKPGQQQFEIREKEILSAIPWAHVVPYFQEDLSKAFAEAHQKH